jgi:hypothetical protein
MLRAPTLSGPARISNTTSAPLGGALVTIS